MALNDDIYYNILIHSNIDTIKILSLTNKSIYNILNNRYFWEEKYINDNFILNDNNILSSKEWIKKYKYDVAKTIADNFIKSAVHGYNYIIRFYINDKIPLSIMFDQDAIKKSVKIYQYYVFQKIEIKIGLNNIVKITHSISDDSRDYTKTIRYSTLINTLLFLTNILYQYPTVKII